MQSAKKHFITNKILSHQTQLNERLQAALDQAAQGRSVIPQRAAKSKDQRVPLVKWKQYQDRRPTPDELGGWWTENPDANPLIVTGAISDLIAIDIDSAEGLAWLEALGDIPRTFTVSRGHPDKRHLWFKHPGFKVGNITLHPDVEVKGDGGTIPAPGAIHWSGAPYFVADDASIADLPASLIEKLRPVERPPRPLPELTTNEHELAALAVAALSPSRAENYYDWVEVGMALRELDSFGLSLWEHFSSQGSAYKPGECAKKWKTFDPSKKTLGTLFYLANQDSPGWRPHRDHPFTRISVHKGSCHKQSRQNDKPRISLQDAFRAFFVPDSDPDLPTVGELVRLLNSDDPKQALNRVDCTPVNRATTKRRNACNSSTSIKDQESGTKIAPTVCPRQNWVRIIFPQTDPIWALLPLDLLAPDHFVGLLTEDEIEDLSAQQDLLDLNKKQQNAIRQRLRTLARVEKHLKELDTLTFVQDRPVDSLADLRRQVLRAIVEHYTKVDPDTGEIIPAKLSNVVQACLVGVTVGALVYIREQGGIEQIAPAEMEKPITHAQRLPPNYRRVVAKDEHGMILDRREKDAPDLADFIDRNRRLGRSVRAVIQPVAEQRLGPLPERQPRQKPERQATDETRAAAAKPSDSSPDKPKPVRIQRRNFRQTYAAELMVNILHHLHIEATKTEPVEVLAGKLRNALVASAEPDRGQMLWEQILRLNLEARAPFYARLSLEDRSLLMAARDRAGRKVAA